MKTVLSRAVDRFFIKNPALRKRVTHAVYGTDNVRVEISGLSLLVNASRENGYLRAFRKGIGSHFLEHEAGALLLLAVLSAKCDCFIDAGANVGLYSASFARRKILEPEFRIMAFEPHPETFARLDGNVAHLGVETYNLALSNEPGVMKFLDGAVSHVFAQSEHRNSYHLEGATMAIPCRRLDSYDVPQMNILIKIDVEGHELAVLEGAEGLFKAKRVAIVYCDGVSDSRAIDFLKEQGFNIFDSKTISPSIKPEFGVLAMRRNEP